MFLITTQGLYHPTINMHGDINCSHKWMNEWINNTRYDLIVNLGNFIIKLITHVHNVI
jgi:hypothetical protein